MSKPLPDGPVRRTWVVNDLHKYHCPTCGSTIGGSLSWTEERGETAYLFCLDCGWYDNREVKRTLLNNPPVIPATIEESYKAFLEETGEGD